MIRVDNGIVGIGGEGEGGWLWCVLGRNVGKRRRYDFNLVDCGLFLEK